MIPWLVLYGISSVLDVFGILRTFTLLNSDPVVFVVYIAFIAFKIYWIMAVNSLFQNIKEKSESGFININIQSVDFLVPFSNEIAQEKDTSYVKMV